MVRMTKVDRARLKVLAVHHKETLVRFVRGAIDDYLIAAHLPLLTPMAGPGRYGERRPIASRVGTRPPALSPTGQPATPRVR